MNYSENYYQQRCEEEQYIEKLRVGRLEDFKKLIGCIVYVRTLVLINEAESTVRREQMSETQRDYKMTLQSLADQTDVCSCSTANGRTVYDDSGN